jgi:hypothetical protein
MIKYAWYAAKLIISREVFSGVKQFAFPDEVKTATCDCSKQSIHSMFLVLQAFVL